MRSALWHRLGLVARPGDAFVGGNPRAARVLTIALGGALAAAAIVSLGWRSYHDLPVMLYCTFLIERFGLVPYRDFFDFNLPGSYFAYGLLTRVFGYGDVGLRVADLLALCYIGVTTYSFLRPAGIGAGLAPVLFGLAYLLAGGAVSWEREYWLVILLATALWVFMHRARLGFGAGALLGGLVFGAMVQIKPHSVIGFPFYLWQITRGARRPLGPVLLALTGLALPSVAACAYLARHGALASFLDIADHYWPLYSGLGRNHEVIAGAGRLRAVLTGLAALGAHGTILVPAALGLFSARSRFDAGCESGARVRLIAGLAICFAFYPALSGQFFRYHFLPLTYFSTMGLALFLGDLSFRRLRSSVPLLALVVLLAALAAIKTYHGGAERIARRLADTETRQRLVHVDAIAAYLQRTTTPDMRVQPLDWTAGALEALLLAGRRTATRFLYDFPFYHHVSSAYTAQLRRSFIEELNTASPEVIVEMTKGKPVPVGPGTSTAFPELSRVLHEAYFVDVRTEYYTVYRRRPPQTAVPGLVPERVPRTVETVGGSP